MPRDPAGTYTYPPGIEGVPDQTIESADYNSFLHDVQADLNLPRPIVAGGSGAASADAALDNLSAEKFKQVVTNWDTTTWRAGSFYAATTATGTAPVASHAFAGIVYYANASDFIIEATDITDSINPAKYIRVMTAGVWGNWMLASGAGGGTGDYTFDSTITFPPSSGQIRFNNATQNSTTEIFISHTTALGIDNSAAINAAIKVGNNVLIQDRDEPTKYKIFAIISDLVTSGSDFRVGVTIRGSGTDIVSGQRVVVSTSSGSAVLYDVTQNLTASQRSLARRNIDVTKKNYIINGAMMVSQENGTTPAGANLYYLVDQFYSNWGGTTGVVAAAQGLLATPSGSTARISLQVNTADAAVGASDYYALTTKIEGLRVSDLLFGASGAKTVTLQFGVRAPAGTYCVGISNGTFDRSYVAEYTIAAGEANTDVVKSVSFTGDTTGTWAKDNNAGLVIFFVLMGGSNFQTPAGAWIAGNKFATANQSNWLGTVNNIFHLFDVSLTEGSVAPPFQVPDYASELAACQRYYWKRNYVAGQLICTMQALSSTTANGKLLDFQTMRAAPSITVSPTAAFSAETSGGGLVASSIPVNATADSCYFSGSGAVFASGLVTGNATAFFANAPGIISGAARL